MAFETWYQPTGVQSRRSPSVVVYFRTPIETVRALRLVAWRKPTVGRPDWGLELDAEQLLQLREAGIPIFAAPVGEENSTARPLDIDALVDQLLESMRRLENGGSTSLRSASA